MSTQPDIFVSYSRDDQATARKFAEGLTQAGFSVWWDQALKSGEAYDRVTEQALRDAKAVVVLWSKRSVNSDWVRAEATIALRNKTLVPVMIEACERPIMFELTQTADLCHWQGAADDKSWQAFVKDVQHFVGTPRAAGSTVPTASATAQGKAITARSWHRQPTARLAAAAVALLVIASAGYVWLQPAAEVPAAAESGVATAPPAASTATATQPTEQSAAQTLAVLPFTNLSTDAEQEYFADGLTEEMISTMAKIDGLQVTGRTSAFYFKGKDTSLMEIGEMLGVEHVLQGSVRKNGNDLRIVAELTAVDTGFTLWTQTYERQLANVFELQEEMAGEVARALSITLGVGDFDSPGMTRDAEAWDAYKKGSRALLNSSQENFAIAIAELEKAVRLDARFAQGWLALAEAYALAISYLPAELTKGYGESRDAAQAQGRLLLPSPYQQARAEGNWQQAEQALLAGLASDPLDPALQRQHVQFLKHVGRLDEARTLIDKHLRADPLNAIFFKESSLVAMTERDIERARRDIADGIALTPDDTDFYFYRTVIGLNEHNWAEAREGFTHLNSTREFGLAILDEYLIPGDLMGATAAIEDAVINRTDLPSILRILTLPMFASALNRTDLVLLLRKEQPWEGQQFEEFHLSTMADFRRLPEFKAYMESSGRASYWRATGLWPWYCQPVTDDFECL